MRVRNIFPMSVDCIKKTFNSARCVRHYLLRFAFQQDLSAMQFECIQIRQSRGAKGITDGFFVLEMCSLARTNRQKKINAV